MRTLTPLLLLSASLACAFLPACKSEGYYAMSDLVGKDRAAICGKRIEKVRDELASVRGAFDDAPVLLTNLINAKDDNWKTASDRAVNVGSRCDGALKNLDSATGQLESVVASTASAWQHGDGSPLDPKSGDLLKARADKLRAVGFAAVTDLRAIGAQLRPAVTDMQEVTRFVANHQTVGNADDLRPLARKAAKGCGGVGDLVDDAKKSLAALEQEIAAGPNAK